MWNAKYLVDARSSMRAQSICKMLIDSLVVNQFWLPAKCQSNRNRSPKMARQITWPCQSMQQSVTTFVRQSFTQSGSHSLSQSVSFAASHKLVAAEVEGEEAEAATPNTASSAIYVVHRERETERENEVGTAGAAACLKKETALGGRGSDCAVAEMGPSCCLVYNCKMNSSCCWPGS